MLNSKTRINFAETDSLTIALNLMNQPDEQDPGGIDADQVAVDRRSARAQNVSFNAGEELSQQKLGLVYRTDRLGGDLLLRNYYVWRDFANRLPFTGGGAVDLERFFYGVGAQYTLTGLGSDNFDLTFGFDLDRQDDDRRRFDNNQGVLGALVFDQREQVDSNGVYAQGTYALNDAWSVNAGIRYDDLQYTISDRFLADGDDSGRRDFSEVSPSVSVSYRNRSNTFFASYSSSFETPTTTELANPDGSGGFNQSINPQQADNFEVGLRGTAQSLSYEFAIFQIDLENELVPFELATSPGRTFYSNAGTSSRSGIEMAMTWTLGGGFSADISYTWSDFKFNSLVDDNGNDFSGNQLAGLPRHFGYFGFRYESESGLSATIESVYSGQLYANTANTVLVSGYAVSNLRMSREFSAGNWTLRPYLGINNIFDESYNSNIRINAFGGRYFEPAPTRNLYAGIVVRFD
jgi:iron complex outermembrane receptor protein